MLLEHRPRHPLLKVRDFQYFWRRKSTLNRSEGRPQISILSFRAVFSHCPVSDPGTLSWCCRGSLTSQINEINCHMTYFWVCLLLFSGFAERIEGKQGWCFSCFQSVSIQITRSLRYFTMKLRENSTEFDWWILRKEEI